MEKRKPKATDFVLTPPEPARPPEPIDRIVAAAMAAHESNRAYCAAIGDPIQPHWDDADEDTRKSMIAGVWGVLRGNTPEMSHARWMEVRLAAGWTVGPVKDEASRQHPNLIPYRDLPAAQRHKDWLFVTVVKAILDCIEAA